MLFSVKEVWDRHCCDATDISFVTKVCGTVFTNFHTVTITRHRKTWIWMFLLLKLIFCTQSPWYQKKLWTSSSFCCWILATMSGVVVLMGLPVCSSLSMNVWPAWTECVVQTPMYGSCFLLQTLVNIANITIIKYHIDIATSENGTKFNPYSLLLSHTHHKIVTHHVHDSKYKTWSQFVHSLTWICIHWLPRYVSTSIYCYIMLLWLLSRWQHKSWLFLILSHILS